MNTTRNDQNFSNQEFQHRTGQVSNQLLQSVLDAAPFSITLLKMLYGKSGEVEDFEIGMVNATTLCGSGLSIGQIIGKRYIEIFPDAVDKGIMEKFREVALSGQPAQFELSYSIDGIYRWVHYKVSRRENLLIVITEDTSNRKRIEDEAKRYSHILQQTEELAKAGSWEYDIKTRQLSWSDGMYRLFAIPKGTPVKPSLYMEQVINEDKPMATKLLEAIEKSYQPLEETLRINTCEGIKTITTRLVVLRNNNDEIEKIIGVDMDVTMVRQTEEMIHGYNQTLLAKNRELASLNSELKTFNSIAANDYNETLRQLYLSLEFIASNDGANLSNSGRANVRRAQSGSTTNEIVD